MGNMNMRCTLIDTWMTILLHFLGQPMTLLCHWFSSKTIPRALFFNKIGTPSVIMHFVFSRDSKQFISVLINLFYL